MLAAWISEDFFGVVADVERTVEPLSWIATSVEIDER